MIQKAIDLNNLPLENLVGFLIIYEMMCKAYEEEFSTKEKNDITLKSKKKKSSENLSDDNEDITFL